MSTPAAQNPALALLDFERRMRSSTSLREAAFRYAFMLTAVGDNSATP